MNKKESIIYLIAYFIISILMILIPLNNELIFIYIYWIGIELYIIAGVYFLYGLIDDDRKKYLFSGLLFGICSWIFLLLTGMNSASTNNRVIEFWHLINTMESFKLVNPVVEVDLPAYIISEILYGVNINYVINSIGLIILTIIGCALLVFVFIKMREEVEGDDDNDDNHDEDDDDEDDDDKEDDDNDNDDDND